ncbi:MAG: DUF484 family protein [Alphaproteobacteria bacterium]|nr:DUF484 family protein [Alphaproteobacteria bacterium]
MTQKLKGVKDDNGLNPDRVIEFLRANPDFFAKHPEAFKAVQAPSRGLGEGVADLQQAMIERLRGDIDEVRSQSQELITTTRANLQTQGRIHECVLALLAANSFESLIQTVTTDFAVILDLDIVTLCVEVEESDMLGIRTRGLVVIEPGTIDAVLGDDRRMVLRGGVTGHPELFGGGASLVQSEALVRLSISKSTPPALLAFGSRDPDRFDAGQATELIDFLAGVLEHVMRIWLHLPE